jgi:NNP family nitrate/nitrite transporter-like MFS transporter
MGIVGAGNSGTVVAALVAPRLAEVVGWHNVFGFALIPVLLTLGFFHVLAKEHPSQPAPRPLGAYLTICRERDLLWLCVFYSFTFGGFVGLASFLVMFFHDQYGLANVTAGNFTALCVFAGSFLRPVGGYLADRFGGTRMLTLLFVSASAGLMAVGLLPPVWCSTLLLFFVMACLGMGNGSVFQLVPQRFRQEIGVATGLVGAAGGIGGFFLLTVMGVAKELVGSYGAGFFCIGLAGLACLALLRIVQPGWRGSWLSAIEAIQMQPEPQT